MARHVLTRDPMQRLSLRLRLAWMLGTALVVVAAWPRVAHATVTIANVTRVLHTHDSAGAYDVSFSDCAKNDQFTFTVNHSNTSGSLSVEVWIAEGSTPQCTSPDARTGTTATCFKVASVPATTNPNTMVINAQDIAGKLAGVMGCNDSNSNTDPRPVVLWFMMIGSPTDMVTDSATWTQMHVDLLGPPAPTDISADFGDTTLIFTYTPPNIDDSAFYNIYCTESGGVTPTSASSASSSAAASSSSSSSSSASAGGAGGAGGGGGAGATGGGGTTSSAGGASASTSSGTSSSSGTGSGDCTSANLEPDKSPMSPTDGSDTYSAKGYFHGQSSGPEVDAADLSNGTRYACGIASVDKLGNIGPLSPLACQTPAALDDFWKLYRQAGGQAGGGYCSIGRSDRWMTFGAALGAAIAALVARRGRRVRGRR